MRDPHRPGSWGWCPIKLLTGWDCPGCGALRAVADLGDGQLGAAWHSNALLVATLPLLVVGWLVWVRRGWRGEASRPSPRVLALGSTAYVVVVLAFAVYRNTVWGAPFHVS